MNKRENAMKNKAQAKREAKRVAIRKFVSGFFHATMGAVGILLFAYALYNNGVEHKETTETHTTTATYESGMLVFSNGNQQGYYADGLQDGQTVEVALNEYGNVVYVKGE